MTKKPVNSLFLKYLIECESKFDTNVEKWIKDFSWTDTDKINEMSEATNEYIVLIRACWGEIGWCLPKWKEQNIILGRVLADLIKGVSVSTIDEGLSDCFKEKEIERITTFVGKHLSGSEKRKLDLSFELYLNQEYFASAVLLAGLIDSASINQVIKSSANPQNVSQCWKCYGKVI